MAERLANCWLILGNIITIMVGKGGLEPPRLAAPDPKSGPSTNSGTPPNVYQLLNIHRNRT